MGILDAIDPDLPELINSLSDNRLRAVTLAVCELTLERIDIDDDVIAEASTALATGAYGDGQLRQRLKGLVDTLDEKAWEVLDLIDEGGATQQQYLAAFAPARAANALYAALDPDARAAATNTLYEAHAALGSQYEAESPIEDARKLTANDVDALRLPVQAAIMSAVRKAMESRG